MICVKRPVSQGRQHQEGQLGRHLPGGHGTNYKGSPLIRRPKLRRRCHRHSRSIRIRRRLRRSRGHRKLIRRSRRRGRHRLRRRRILIRQRLRRRWPNGGRWRGYWRRSIRHRLRRCQRRWRKCSRRGRTDRPRSLRELHRPFRLGHRPFIFPRPTANHRLRHIIQRIGIVLQRAGPLITGRPRVKQIRRRDISATTARQRNHPRNRRDAPEVKLIAHACGQRNIRISAPNVGPRIIGSRPNLAKLDRNCHHEGSQTLLSANRRRQSNPPDARTVN